MCNFTKFRTTFIYSDCIDNRTIKRFRRINKIFVLESLLKNRSENLPILARHIKINVVVPRNKTTVPRSP